MTNSFNPKPINGDSRQSLSTEDWLEKKRLEKTELYQEINDTAYEISRNPELFQKYLDTQSRNNRYSVANCMTILKHCPNASKLREFDDWVSDGAKIKKGEKSIPILDPYEYIKKDGSPAVDFNIKKMFDVSQTTARQIPAPTANKDPQALVVIMIDTSPVPVEVRDELPHPEMKAFYSNENQTLYVKRNIGDSVSLFQAVATEISPAQLSIDSDEYSRKDMAFPALCSAYMLCKKYGVDARNLCIDRLPEEWKDKSSKELRSDLTSIRLAMNEINSRVSEEVYRQKLERSKGHER